MANTLSPLNAISPIDGRYQSKTDSLSPYFSEFGLIKYRVIIEIEYLIALSESKTTPLDFNTDQQSALRSVVKDFSEVDALRIKEIEKITNHDVKAVEYFIKERFAGNAELEAVSEFVELRAPDAGSSSGGLSSANVRGP